MSFTVGKLEDLLRQFHKDTEIHSDCGNCHHGSNTDIKINDKTGQTYGYIELVLNDRNDPKIECASDEKQFYEKELERLNSQNEELKKRLELYKEMTESFESKLMMYKRWAGECNV